MEDIVKQKHLIFINRLIIHKPKNFILMTTLKNAVVLSGAISLQEYDSYLYPIKCQSDGHAQDFYYVDFDKRRTHDLKVRCINDFIFIFNLDQDILYKFHSAHEYLDFIKLGELNKHLRR